jgi:hypothetical protein
MSFAAGFIAGVVVALCGVAFLVVNNDHTMQRDKGTAERYREDDAARRTR